MSIFNLTFRGVRSEGPEWNQIARPQPRRDRQTPLVYATIAGIVCWRNRTKNRPP